MEDGIHGPELELRAVVNVVLILIKPTVKLALQLDPGGHTFRTVKLRETGEVQLD
jgi:hypothetical protein